MHALSIHELLLTGWLKRVGRFILDGVADPRGIATLDVSVVH